MFDETARGPGGEASLPAAAAVEPVPPQAVLSGWDPSASMLPRAKCRSVYDGCCVARETVGLVGQPTQPDERLSQYYNITPVNLKNEQNFQQIMFDENNNASRFSPSIQLI